MVKLLFVLTNEYRLWALPQTLAALERRYPDAVEGRIYSVREIDADAGLERAFLAGDAAVDMAFLASHGSIQNLYYFSRLQEALEGRPVYFTSTMGGELAELLPRLGLEPALYVALDSYYQAGSPADLEGLMLYTLNGRFGRDYPLSPPGPPRGQGMYTLEGFLPPEREAGHRTRMAVETRSVVDVLIHDYYARTGNLEHVDALPWAIQTREGVPYALSDSFAADHGMEQGILYRMERFYRRVDDTPAPGALMMSYGSSLTTLAEREARADQVPASVSENWGLPVIQRLTTYFSADKYRRDVRGLDLVSLPVCVYQPELDGQLISVPYVVTERTADRRKVYRPLPNRATRVAKLACRQAELARKPVPKKKVAIIFHNMPPHGDAIGSVHGLDTPETVFRVVRVLGNQDLHTTYSFSSGAGIVVRIRAAVTNDGRWLSPEAALKRAEATVPVEQYQRWFNRLNPETRAQMEENWDPAPGTAMVSGGQIVIPGIRNGNLFMGVQPIRSAPEWAEKLCHSTDSTLSHSCLTFYRWMDEVFGVNVVLHAGTHGILGWLPGKEVGLSSGCFGDICIGRVPHFYIYNINILGKGMQARRRSYACILDHLIPSTDDASTYGDLTGLDEAIDGYYRTHQARPAQVPALLERIFTLTEELKATTNLQLERADLEAEPENGMARLHRWISHIKISLVWDGLHIYGQPPEGERFDHLARTLVRMSNGAVPALKDDILLAQGQAPEELRAAPERLYPDGRAALRIMDGAIATARRLFARLSTKGYRPEAVAELLAGEGSPGGTTPLAQILDFVCTRAAPWLRQITDELDLLLAGVEGRFVPSLLGGSPSRGNAHILPTSRDFYTIDPATVPDRAAWTVGQALAERAVDTYRAQKGEP